MGGHSTHLRKRRFKVFSNKSCGKFDRCDGELSWTNIQSSRLTSFLIAGNNCFLNVYTNSLYYYNTIFIHKKRFRGAVPRDCSGNHKFSWNLIRGRKQVLIWNIRFLPYTRSFCKLTGTSRVKSFSSCHTVFSIMRVLRSNFSANAVARAYLLLRHRSFISGVFTLLNWRNFFLFIIILIVERLILVCSAILRGARCVCGTPSWEQISFSIKSVFYSVVTDLGRPEPSFLFMMTLSLKRLKSLFTDV